MARCLQEGGFLYPSPFHPASGAPYPESHSSDAVGLRNLLGCWVSGEVLKCWRLVGRIWDLYIFEVDGNIGGVNSLPEPLQWPL